MTENTNIHFAVTTVAYDAYDHRLFDSQLKRKMQFKAAANYASSCIKDEQNYTFNAWGSPYWKIALVIRHSPSGHELIEMGEDGGIRYHPDLLTNDYPAAMYVITSMQNAIAEVKARSEREVTPSEIEKALNLKAGVVRKYIFDNRALLEERELVRHADGRTLLIKWGGAMAIWGKHGTKRVADIPESDFAISRDRLKPEIWMQLEALEYNPMTVTALAEYSRTVTLDAAGRKVCIQKHETKHRTVYTVLTWKPDGKIRDADLILAQSANGEVVSTFAYTEENFSLKLKALAVFGITV